MIKKLLLNINISQIIRFGYYFLIFFTPLLFSLHTSEIFEFNKMIFIYAVAVLVSILYIVKLIATTKKITLSLPPFLFVLLIFLIGQLLSTIFSIDRHTSIFGYYSRFNGGLVSIIAYVTLFFVFVQTFQKKHLERLLFVSLLSSCVVILWGLLAKFGYDPTCYLYLGEITNRCWTAGFDPTLRMFATLGQPNWFGAYMVIHFFIGLYFLLISHSEGLPAGRQEVEESRDKRFTRFQSRTTMIYFLYLLLNLLTVWFTNSRSSQLALIIAFICGLAVFTFSYLSKNKKRILLGGIFSLIFLLTLFGYTQKQKISNFFALPTQTSTITDSFEIRKIVWTGAIDLGMRYPILGSGVETFAYAYYFTRPAAHNLTSEWDFIYNKAHNEFLNYFATGGWVGLLSYLAVIVGTGMLVFKTCKTYKTDSIYGQKVMGACLFMSYSSILVTNFFGFSISIIQIFFYLIPALLVVMLGRRENADVTLQFKKLTLSKKMGLFIVVLFAATLFTYLLRYYQADMAYASAQKHLSGQEYKEATEELYRALSYRYEHVYEDKLSSALAGLAFVSSFDEEKETVNKLVSYSKDHNQNAINQSPKNILYYKTQAKNYYLYYQVTHDFADLEKSLSASKKVISIAKTDAQSYYQLGVYYWIASQESKDNKDEYLNEAEKNINKSISMKPNYIEAQELLSEIRAPKE